MNYIILKLSQNLDTVKKERRLGPKIGKLLTTLKWGNALLLKIAHRISGETRRQGHDNSKNEVWAQSRALEDAKAGGCLKV